MLIWPQFALHPFFVSYFLNTVSFTFSTLAMIFAVIKLSREIQAIKTLVPHACFLWTHAILLTLLFAAASFLNYY